MAVLTSIAVVDVQTPMITLVGHVVGNAINLSWSGPAGPPIVGYRGQAGSMSGQADIAEVSVVSNHFNATSVPTGTYFVRVSGRLANGETVGSNEVVLNVGGCAAPAAPREFAAAVSGSSVTFSWIPTAGADNYVLEAGSQSGLSDVAQFHVGQLLTLTASGPPGRYHVRVRAANTCGVGPPSGVAVVVLGGTFRCGMMPGPTNRSIPIFSAPFTPSNSYLMYFTQYFDHDLPLGSAFYPAQTLTFCGERLDGRLSAHRGVDWPLPIGTPILAVAEGQVVRAGLDPTFFCDALGRMVTDQTRIELMHPIVGGERFSSQYVHVSRIDVQVGQQVARGQLIALSGKNGCAAGAGHLHFEVHRHTNTNSGRPTWIDPFGWDGAGVDPWAIHPEGAASFWLWRPGEAPWLR